MIRRDTVEAVGKIPEILFPVFTNGLLIDDGYIDLFNRLRKVMVGAKGNLSAAWNCIMDM